MVCEGCVYNNNCLATAAGFTTEGVCTPICPEVDPTTLTSASGTACTTEYNPVYCLGCEFDNECVATSLGFDIAADCSSITVPKTLADGEDEPMMNTTTTSGATMKQGATVMVVVFMAWIPVVYLA